MLLPERAEHLRVQGGGRRHAVRGRGPRRCGGRGGGGHSLAEPFELLVLLRRFESDGLRLSLCAGEELLRLGLRLCALIELVTEGCELCGLRLHRVRQTADFVHVGVGHRAQFGALLFEVCDALLRRGELRLQLRVCLLKLVGVLLERSTLPVERSLEDVPLPFDGAFLVFKLLDVDFKSSDHVVPRLDGTLETVGLLTQSQLLVCKLHDLWTHFVE